MHPAYRISSTSMQKVCKYPRKHIIIAFLISFTQSCNPSNDPLQVTVPLDEEPTESYTCPICFINKEEPPKSYEALIGHFKRALQTREGEQSIVDFTRNIAAIADANRLNHNGFEWEIINIAGQMQVRMQGTPAPLGHKGYLDRAYEEGNGATSFGEYIKEAKGRGAQTAIFRTPFKGSRSPGRILAIPVGEHTTVYHFSKSATDQEIIAFWKDTIESLHKFGIEAVEYIRINTGEIYWQSVSHFHLRFKISAKYHEKLKKDYYCNLPDE